MFRTTVLITSQSICIMQLGGRFLLSGGGCKKEPTLICPQLTLEWLRLWSRQPKRAEFYEDGKSTDHHGAAELLHVGDVICEEGWGWDEKVPCGRRSKRRCGVLGRHSPMLVEKNSSGSLSRESPFGSSPPPPNWQRGCANRLGAKGCANRIARVPLSCSASAMPASARKRTRLDE